jgi:hypothetical protein
MQIRRNCISPVLVAASVGASTGAAPTSAIVGRSGSAVPESLRTVGVPVYSHTEVLTGSAIMLALCLVVLVALAVGWRGCGNGSGVIRRAARWSHMRVIRG